MFCSKQIHSNSMFRGQGFVQNRVSTVQNSKKQLDKRLDTKRNSLTPKKKKQPATTKTTQQAPVATSPHNQNDHEEIEEQQLDPLFQLSFLLYVLGSSSNSDSYHQVTQNVAEPTQQEAPTLQE